MNFLFVHQNFPGQFKHVVRSLAGQRRHRVFGIGETINLKDRPQVHPRVSLRGYEIKKGGNPETHHYIRDFEGAVRRGQEVARIAINLGKQGFTPDVVISHPGWGESLFLRDVFPDARHIVYCEYYYQGTGGDVGFDPEFPTVFDDRFRIRMKNSTQLHSLEALDAGLSPTLWQQSLYPEIFRSKIRVIHEGIDTGTVMPDFAATVDVGGVVLSRKDKVITYVSRNLEPYRGFHSFMRSLPLLQDRCPDARIVVVGGDGVSYGRKLPDGSSYRQRYTEEVRERVDWSKVYFTGKIPYSRYLRILQVSSAHIYLTYPFVLSWSMLEAMSAGCVVIGSATTPVQEVITHGKNGLLVDFFDTEQLAKVVSDVVNHRHDYQEFRLAARETVRERYDLRATCLPAQLQLITGI